MKPFKQRLFRDRLKEDLQNPAFRKAYEEADLSVRLAYEITRARTQAGITQKELGVRTGMKQQAVARLESANFANPSIKTIEKIAIALRPHFRFVIEEPKDLAA